MYRPYIIRYYLKNLQFSEMKPKATRKLSSRGYLIIHRWQHAKKKWFPLLDCLLCHRKFMKLSGPFHFNFILQPKMTKIILICKMYKPLQTSVTQCKHVKSFNLICYLNASKSWICRVCVVTWKVQIVEHPKLDYIFWGSNYTFLTLK